MLGLALEPAALTMIFPFSMLSFPTLKASVPGAPPALEAGFLVALFAPLPPKLE